jgi:hypothetical protein
MEKDSKDVFVTFLSQNPLLAVGALALFVFLVFLLFRGNTITNNSRNKIGRKSLISGDISQGNVVRLLSRICINIAEAINVYYFRISAQIGKRINCLERWSSDDAL